MTVLVTGGAGYVGSHAVKELRANGIHCIVLDNLSRGRRDLVLDAELIVGDIADTQLVEEIVRSHDVRAVMHFAAFAYVGESMQHPSMYYQNNVSATIRLLDVLARLGVKRFVFSSTCATYGLPQATPITEDHPQQPVNPYGASKLMIERILRDFESAYGLRSVIFRYFNAAGADPEGRIGEIHDPETHLIPLTLDVALGTKQAIDVFGDDYPTPDGTCIRDYIHVSDLAVAHRLGLRYLEDSGAGAAFNLGNGSGFSVREVIDTVQRVTGKTIKANFVGRRPGDPHQLVGSSAKAYQVLGWSPRFTALDSIVETAWSWHRSRR